MANPEGGASPAPQIETLQRLCYTGSDRPFIATPFHMQYDGVRWAVGTDGHLLAALPFDGYLGTDGPDAAAILKAEPPPTEDVQLPLLRSWAGPPYPSESQCPKCNGTPPRMEYCPGHPRGRHCPDCDSLGKQIEGIRHGLLLRGGLNRLLLAKLLCSVPDGVTDLRIGHAGPLAPYVFRASGWIGCIMPINGADKDAPRFGKDCPTESQDRPPKASP